MADPGRMTITGLLWAAWCFQHSFLICRWWTARMRRLLRGKFGYYRIFFNLFSVLTVTPLVFYQFSLDQTVLFSWSGGWRIVQIVGLVYAGYMLYSGAVRYDMAYFLGIEQVREIVHKNPPPEKPFTADRRGGVRHPWYSGGIVLVWVWGPVTDVNLVTAAVLSAYFVIGAVLEERKLLIEIGEPYARYRRSVPMLIPGLKGDR